MKTFEVLSTDIEDIEVARPFKAAAPAAFSPVSAKTANGALSSHTPSQNPRTPNEKQVLEDPAILSYSKSPNKATSAPRGGSSWPPSIDSSSLRASELLSNTTALQKNVLVDLKHAEARSDPSLYAKTLPLRPVPNGQKARTSTTTPATKAPNPVEIFVTDNTATPNASHYARDPALEASDTLGQVHEIDLSSSRPLPIGSKRIRSSKQKSAATTGHSNAPTLANNESASSGWRQTPILQDPLHETPRKSSHNNIPTSSKAASTSKKANARNKKVLDGWGTEDATDIQDMGDFDFVGNLSKFDKRSVFEQLRNDDTTADEDRLVSFNRAGPAGTFGGTKLHFSENVISRSRMNSKDAAPSDSDNDHEFGGTPTRRTPRTRSRVSLHHVESIKRKGSSTISESANPGLSDRANPAYNPIHKQITQPPEPSIARGLGISTPSGSGGRRPTLRYTRTNRVCQTAHPDTIHFIEKHAIQTYSITEDIISENAGRSIAEIAMAALNPGSRRIYAGNHNAQPVVVILAGNNNAGARAIAAARHLMERGVRIVAAVTTAEESHAEPYSDLNPFLVSQMRRFSNRTMSWSKAAALLKTLDAPPELIIDALLDIHTTFADLDAAEEEVANAMLGWANKSKASVLAVEVPSGVDTVSGKVEVRDGEPLEVRAKIVACCAAPCVGLLRAMEERAGDGDEWIVHVMDVGVNAAWREASKAAKTGKWVAFGSEWVVKLRFDMGRG